MINQRDVLAVLDKHRGDAIVIPTMTASRGWHETSHLANRDVSIAGAMSKASSFALGVALAQPNIKVLVIDGDGSLEMNLGSLCTIAEKQPENFYHFLLENGVYAVTGGQPIPGKDRVSFAGIAKGAGYAATYEFDNLEDFTVTVEGILKQKGPVFITIKTVPEVQNEPIALRQRPAGIRSTPQAIRDLQESLATT